MAAEQVVEDFKALLEKSQSFFSNLRDLPQYENKQWKAFYEKTFEVYNKLWKFQQEHRAVLENSDYYGLKRWQIGEIASKIGQLYYHYYLRTSELLYLREAYVFYEAIRSRGYFQDVFDEQSVPLVVKKLRYYARFALVCLLLDRCDKAHELCEELATNCDSYAQAFEAPDAVEWAEVTQELRQFLAATDTVRVVGEAQVRQLPLFDSSGLPIAIVPPPNGFVKLEVAVLVGSAKNQIRFSEMPLDVFRVVTSMEASVDTDSHTARCPSKHMQFCPSFDKLFVTLASVCKELPETNSAVMLYVSADAGNIGGQEGLALGEGSQQGTDGLLPADLMPLLRHPLCLVVDSPNSSFCGLSSPFGKPVVCLTAPKETPPEVPDVQQIGSFFTFFLSHPLQALCASCNIVELEQDVYAQAEECITSVFAAIYSELQAAADLNKSIQAMLGDQVLANLIFRFAFFDAVAGAHVHFKSKPEYKPAISPALPSSVKSSQPIKAGIQKLGQIINTGFLA